MKSVLSKVKPVKRLSVDAVADFFASESIVPVEFASPVGEKSPALPSRPEGTAAGDAPPSLLGGVKWQGHRKRSETGVHWLQGTVPVAKLRGLIEYVSGMCGGAPSEKDWGRYRYDASYVWEAFGVSIFYDRSGEKAERVHGGRACFCMPGSAIDLLSDKGVYGLLRDLCHRFWFKATRIDCYFDDRARSIVPHEVAAECERGNFAGYRRWDHSSPRRRVGTRSERVGDMVTFGRRGDKGSGRYVRVYDKLIESGGENTAVRWEVEFSGERAQKACWGLASSWSFEYFRGRVGGLVGGSVDFVNREDAGQDKHLSRMRRLTWWGKIRKRLGRVRVRIAAKFATVEKSQEWLCSQVAATLATVRSAIGESKWQAFHRAMMDTGEGNMRRRHRAIVEAYRAEVVGVAV